MSRPDIDSLLKSYPRTRPPLTDAHKAVYVEEYKINRGEEGLLYRVISVLESWGHRRIAREMSSGDVLELGAGSLNHLSFEPKVIHYDCVEPFSDLYRDSPDLDRVRSMYVDVDDIPCNHKYSRIISIAVLEHLDNLPYIVAKSLLHMRPSGVFQAVIPSEGGFLWGAAWRLTTGISYRLRTGLDYKTLMRHEHINSAIEVLAIVQFLFRAVNIARFPLPGQHFSFYTYIEAEKPNYDLAKQLVETSR